MTNCEYNVSLTIYEKTYFTQLLLLNHGLRSLWFMMMQTIEAQYIFWKIMHLG
jgi:hypothetical protein